MNPARPTSSGRIPAPREIVLASAGTGKTYTLSSRLIGLLIRGVSADAVLASTFTRKAAGEILARVLSRLAEASLDPDRARELAHEVGLSQGDGGPGPAPSKIFSSLLRELVREIHRLNIGTLDSFFVRVAGSFAGDLGLPPEWAISDEPTARRLESEALQEVLAPARPGEMAELVRMTMRGESGRGVHGRLLAQLKEIRSLLHQQGGSTPDSVWSPPRPDPRRFPSEGTPPTWESVIGALEACPLPATAKGFPDSRFQNGIAGAVRALRERAWEAFCETGLGARALAGEGQFAGKPIPPELLEALESALFAVSRALAVDLGNQTRALRTLATGFDEALSRLHRREGAYRFEDITFLLGGERPATSRTDLWYRLDQKTHHLLLDEFQDTSRPQWEALEPLAKELLAGQGEERSVLVVADPKQSIYGWRGAEPALAERVGERFGLKDRALHESYRSSGPVLELVNRVFSPLPSNPLWEREPDLQGSVEKWAHAFREHRAAKDLPGYVSFEAGPEDPGRGSDRPALMEWAAARILELHTRLPGATVGVLVRRNATVARLMGHLRRLGMDASEEGATALTDSPAVSTCLALFRLADHPGDTVGRYQVALSPLGAVSGLTEFNDPNRAREVSLRVRRLLLTEGYGPLITEWTRALGVLGALDDRELGRMLQLAELGHHWDARSTLRPQDFVRFVENEAMESPSDALVRVMTVHKAKGLEFDVVVLPELDLRLTTGRGLHRAVLPFRDPESGKVSRIFPNLSKALLPFFPEVSDAGRQDRERELQDALGVVYVALTRAKHALHLFTGARAEEGDLNLPYTPAGLLRGALCRPGTPVREGATLFHTGSRTWWEGLPLSQERGEGGEKPVEVVPNAILLSKDGGVSGRRFLQHRSPSSLREAGAPPLGRILTLDSGTGRRRGTLTHAWLEHLEWIDGWNPEPDTLLAIGRSVLPDLDPTESEEHYGLLSGWLEAPEIRARLSRENYPPKSQVLTEEPFAFRWDEILYQGRMDRLVLTWTDDQVKEAQVLDFKTDAVDPQEPEALTRLADEYRGQLEIYRNAVSRTFGIPLEQVSGVLMFLAAGQVVEFSD